MSAFKIAVVILLLWLAFGTLFAFIIAPVLKKRRLAMEAAARRYAELKAAAIAEQDRQDAEAIAITRDDGITVDLDDELRDLIRRDGGA